MDLSRIQLSENRLSNIPTGTTIYVGMSGGVDSSVVASMLVDQKYNVIGVFLDCWYKNEYECSSDSDRIDALKVATSLGIKFLTWDFREVYRQKVLTYFLRSYQKGLTPNPDILCNTFVKFGAFVERVRDEDPQAFIATGHYAKIFNIIGQARLLLGKSSDIHKDQSYFLYDINPGVLNKVTFPLGCWQKKDVRDYASKRGLVVSKKPDSQGVCFTGGIDVKGYLLDNLGIKKGSVVDTTGNTIGSHDGIHLYTIGERFTQIQWATKLYIVDKIVKDNVLVVSDKPVLRKTFYVVISSHYFDVIDYVLEFDLDIWVQIRNTGKLNSCKIFRVGKSDRIKVSLFKEIGGIASGQSAVFYVKVNGEYLVVLGGAIFSSVVSD